ncbi:hypothetical protein Pan241w_48470 [Gimesia alba]|uniref:Uncharacterized protein n=1 Tax=Gimesia alba TaxID=2527973 RepID=A0A517RLH4_9PLAN|nr:hypothetical protein [Gimesia alba]QDT44731.1 hypothetical protein Pan241w_48470 [Gimesia alba]
MAALNLLFLIILFTLTFAVIAAVVAGGLWLFGVGRKRRWITVTFVLYCGFIAVDFYLSMRPAAVFERQFGFSPSPQVQNLTSTHWVLGDYGKITLSFYAPRETVDRILQRGMERQPDVGRAVHYHRTYSEYFGRETEDLYFDETTGCAGYTWIGVD